jgi:RimJ/RimL family protein N-acetyltransferase
MTLSCSTVTNKCVNSYYLSRESFFIENWRSSHLQKKLLYQFGVVEFGTNEGGAKGSVDYAMSEDFWNQGIMTVNPASTRVQEKGGMTLVRREQCKWEKFEEPVDLVVCMITREEWMTTNKHPNATSESAR